MREDEHTYTYGQMENAVELADQLALRFPNWGSSNRTWEEHGGSAACLEYVIQVASELDTQVNRAGIMWGDQLDWIETCEALAGVVAERGAYGNAAVLVAEFLVKANIGFTGMQEG